MSRVTDARLTRSCLAAAAVLCAIMCTALAAAGGETAGDNAPIQFTLKHALDNLKPRVRGTVVSKGFGRKGTVAHGKVTTDQSINARSLMMAEYYKVIIETGDENSVPLIASMKPVCSTPCHFLSQRARQKNVTARCVYVCSASWRLLLLAMARLRTR